MNPYHGLAWIWTCDRCCHCFSYSDHSPSFNNLRKFFEAACSKPLIGQTCVMCHQIAAVTKRIVFNTDCPLINIIGRLKTLGIQVHVLLNVVTIGDKSIANKFNRNYMLPTWIHWLTSSLSNMVESLFPLHILCWRYLLHIIYGF